MEKLKIKKTGKGKFGYYLLIDDGAEVGNFKSTTEMVSNFLLKEIPCEIEVLDVGEKGVITSVKIANSANEPDSPIETVKVTESGYKPALDYKDARQESIEKQMSVKAAIEMVRIQNESGEEKIKPTIQNIEETAKLVKNLIEKDW